MTPIKFESRLDAARDRLAPAEHFLRLFGDHLASPIWYQSVGAHCGFRYMTPDARHFCMLKGVRAVGGMSACIHLARGGYTQEIAVIIRTVVECTFLMDWVRLKSEPSGVLRSDPQLTYVKRYFDDYRRDRPGESLKLGVRQGDVHREVGDWLDQRTREVGLDMSGGSAQRLSNVYQTNSSYVHARYPEVMDLYGGTPPFFHLHGMRETPKDDENVAIIEAYSTTVDLAIMGIARRFGTQFAQTDIVLKSWLDHL